MRQRHDPLAHPLAELRSLSPDVHPTHAAPWAGHPDPARVAQTRSRVPASPKSLIEGQLRVTSVALRVIE